MSRNTPHHRQPAGKICPNPGRSAKFSRVNELSVVFAAVLPVMTIMVVGFWVRRLGWLTAEADQSLLRLCVNLLLPALIFESVLGNPALQRPENLILPPLVAIVTVLAGIGISGLASRYAGLDSPAARRTFALTTGLQNYGYIPLPLCQMLFDPGTVGVLLVHNVGVELTLWTVGVRVLSGRQGRPNLRQIFSPPLVVLLLALLLNIIPANAVPAQVLATGRVVMTAVHWLGQCAIPLALLMIGAMIADHLSELHGGRLARVITTAMAVRLLIMPILFLALARCLPCSVELKRVIVVQAAMASAVLPVVLAKHYGGDTRTALQVILGTSAAGLITIPLWIRLGGKIVGLW